MQTLKILRVVAVLLAALPRPDHAVAAPSCVDGVDSELVQFDPFKNFTGEPDLLDRLKDSVACVSTSRSAKGKGTLKVEIETKLVYIQLPLDYQEQSPAIYWPEHTDLLARFDHHARLSSPKSPNGCAEVGELKIWKSYLIYLKLALPHDINLAQYTFKSDDAQFTQPQTDEFDLTCFNPRGFHKASDPVAFKFIKAADSIANVKGSGCISIHRGDATPIAQIPLDDFLKHTSPLPLSSYIGRSCNSESGAGGANFFAVQLQADAVKQVGDAQILPLLADGSVVFSVNSGP